MLEPKIVPPEGTGLHRDEVTLAELLKKVGYNTAHIGKWHQGDIAQAAPHNQGFDTASYPLHNQATFNFMTIESEEDRLADNVAVNTHDALAFQAGMVWDFRIFGGTDWWDDHDEG